MKLMSLANSLFLEIIWNSGWKNNNFVKKFGIDGAANSYELALVINSYGFLPISIVRISWTPLYFNCNAITSTWIGYGIHFWNI